MRRPDPLPTLEQITARLAQFDVTHVGVAAAGILTETRSTLHARRSARLHDGMGFTYRNPDRSTDPDRAVADAASIVVAARPYLTDREPGRPPPAAGPHARVGKYAWVDHYAPLRAGLRAVAHQIRRAGHRAVAFADDNAIVDRAVAHRAGLGWYGKNTNLLIPGGGSFFVLGCLVTTAEYEPAPAPVDDACGACVRCVEGCPTGAIIEPGVIDAAKCLSWVLQKPGSIAPELRAAVDDRIYGCDDCQDVCPISVRLGPRNTVALAAEAEAWVDAIRLLAADDDEIERRYGRWYIAGREMRWLRRNALVVIGNVGEPSDRRVRSVLAHYRSGDDPILAEHADWANDRLDARA